VSSRFCSVSRVEYASQPTALQLESPPYVVGPSAESSVDALNPTVIPDGIVASPRAIVNVSTHVADGEHTIRQSNSAWHRVASSTVGFALTHVYAGGGHAEENASNVAGADDDVEARAVDASAAAVTATLSEMRCRCRPIASRGVPMRAMILPPRAPTAPTSVVRRAPTRTKPRALVSAPTRFARAMGPLGVARASSSSSATNEDDDDAKTASAFYAYDETLWRAAENALGDVPSAPWLSKLQIAIVLALSMAVDAGFSGDWSRIGALTTDQEAFIRAFLVFVAVAHGALGVVAYDIAVKRGRDRSGAVLAFLKVFVVGFTALVEVSFGEDET
jgi:hypothetical protein